MWGEACQAAPHAIALDADDLRFPYQPQFLPDPVLNRLPNGDVVLQELLGVFATLTEPVAAVSEPGAALFDNPLFDGQVEEVALTRDPFAIHDVELGFAERWRHLVLDHL